ncbi:WD40 repeat-like protein [Paramyrothecium foliicola]|nr:WD40 repeat-like protein [Paramyrothecium foliicola]
MRLLRFSNTGRVYFTNFADEKTIPPYAILSHTWGPDADEVKFEDIVNETYETKTGYEKIRFCGEQAQQDDLHYFWIDTCCINRTDKSELSLAIQSMFRWYQKAAQCYVYLSDFSMPGAGATSLRSRSSKACFQESKWFSRGWTLQELLAPSNVSFFSREGRRLGDKTSLRQEIHEVTGIPYAALDGSLLSQFGIQERLQWKEGRETRVEEDLAYSLSGIFDVALLPSYGEGAVSAFKRLMEEVEKAENCIRDLRSIDARVEKIRIENMKGGLLEDSCRWAFEHESFQKWRDNQKSELLWVRGGPGMGKTMLLCSKIDELHRINPENGVLAYFFCQATDFRINSATAVLRGLLYLLVSQQPSLVIHVRKRYDHAGRTIFEKASARITMMEILADVLQDLNLKPTYLVVDALDECVKDLPQLLEFIGEQASTNPRVKWLVSGRNLPTIAEGLGSASNSVLELSLELNAELVSMAVHAFINAQVIHLARVNEYDESTQSAVLKHLVANAESNFLWAALVCQDLKKTSKEDVLKALASYRPGLDWLYKKMLQRIRESDPAGRCDLILATAACVYQPIGVHEMAALVANFEHPGVQGESMQEIVSRCGSFLTIHEHTVYFVHQSACDFFLSEEVGESQSSRRENIHHHLFAQSLKLLSKTLKRDLYSLEALGFPAVDVQLPDPDPLVACRYSCVHWIDHLCDSNKTVDLNDESVLDNFMRSKYLYWLEAASLCKTIPKAEASMTRLWGLIQGKIETTQLAKLVKDARQLLSFHKTAIENYPLQAYGSALVFSPSSSLTKQLFRHEEPQWIEVKTGLNDDWSPDVQMLRSHDGGTSCMAFSHDSNFLASAKDNVIKTWKTRTGECIRTFKGHSSKVMTVAFSSDASQLISGSLDRTVKIWDLRRGRCMRTFEEHDSGVHSVVMSHDLSWLASASGDGDIKIWDASSGACLRTLNGNGPVSMHVTASHDLTLLASGTGTWGGTVKLWDINSGTCVRTWHDLEVEWVAISPNAAWVAAGSFDEISIVWDVASGEKLWSSSGCWESAVFSHDSTLIAAGTGSNQVQVWDVRSGACLKVFRGHASAVSALAFSLNSNQLTSVSENGIIMLWDMNSETALETHERKRYCLVRDIAISVASAFTLSEDGTIRTWSLSSGACLNVLETRDENLHSLVLSHDKTLLALVGDSDSIELLNTSSGARFRNLQANYSSPRSTIGSIAFSPESEWLASIWRSDRIVVHLWVISTGACRYVFKGQAGARGTNPFYDSVTFSPDSTLLAFTSGDGVVEMRETNGGTRWQVVDTHHDDSSQITCLAFSPDSRRLAAGSTDKTIQIWDADLGTLLQQITTSQVPYGLSYGSTSSYFHESERLGFFDTSTTSGTVGDTSLSDDQLLYAEVRQHSYSQYSDWVRFRGQNMLWVPPEYRGVQAVHNNVLVIGSRAERLCIYSIDQG